MTLAGDLAALAQQGVQLWVEDGKLRIRAPRGVLTPATREMLARQKDEILELLRFQTVPRLTGVVADQGTVSGPVPLTPSQHAFLYDSGTHRFNRPVGPIRMEVRIPMDPVLLKQAVAELVAHHDALRMRFERQGKAWHQTNLSREECEIFSHSDVSHVPAEKRKAAVKAIERRALKDINITRGPIIRVVLVTQGPTAPVRFFFVIHHLVIDFYSMLILARDLESAYLQLQANEAVRLPPKTTSFKLWAERLDEYAGSNELHQEREYWLTMCRDRPSSPPIDFRQLRGPIGRRRAVKVALTAEETGAVMQDLPARHGINSMAVVLAALSQAYSRWTGSSLYVEVWTHGRQSLLEDIDVARTVGWFASRYPLVVDLEGHSDSLAALCAVDRQIKATPNGGVGYGILRSVIGDPSIRNARIPRIVFNFRSQSEDLSSESVVFAPLRPSGEPSSAWFPAQRLQNWRVSLLDGQLRFFFNYHEAVFRRSTMERLADRTIEAIRTFISDAASQ